MPRLTERQAAFARHLITGMSATEAARKAGYSDSYANREAKRLVDKPQVATYLKELRSKVEDDSIMTAQEVLRELTSIARGQGFADKSTKEGIVDIGPEWSDRTKALGMLAKHHKLVTDKHEHVLRRDPREMTLDELEEYLSERGLLD